MRVLITGVDNEGRSCVIEESTPAVSNVHDGVTIAFASGTESSPPPARPPGRGSVVPVKAAPGIVRWSYVEYPPNITTDIHHTDSIDFDVVITGSVDIVLDDGAHRLGPGDGVVVNGVDHGWATQDEGCQMSVVVVGTPPRESD